jgi:hypothetical protein
VAARDAAPAAIAGPTDAADLDQILADDADIEQHRQAIIDRHAGDGTALAPVMLALSRIAGLTEQLDIEVRFVRRWLGGEP